MITVLTKFYEITFDMKIYCGFDMKRFTSASKIGKLL